MFETSRAIASCKIKSVTVAGSASAISDKVKSLGVTFDSQVKAMCKAMHYHARSLHHIRRSLLDTFAKSIAGFIIARLDSALGHRMQIFRDYR